jgi:methanogenic corrinoid protein MtbC1
MDLSILKQALIEGDDQTVADLTQRALNEDHSAETILNDALISGMEEVGELFEQGEYFVPELHGNSAGRPPRHRQEAGGDDAGGQRLRGD